MAISSPNYVPQQTSGMDYLQRGMAQLQEYGQWRGSLREQIRQADMTFSQNFMNMYQANPDAMINFARQNGDMFTGMLSSLSKVNPEAAAGFVSDMAANSLTPQGEVQKALGEYLRGMVAQGGVDESGAQQIYETIFATPEEGDTPQPGATPRAGEPVVEEMPGATQPQQSPVTAPGAEPWMNAQPQPQPQTGRAVTPVTSVTPGIQAENLRRAPTSAARPATSVTPTISGAAPASAQPAQVPFTSVTPAIGQGQAVDPNQAMINRWQEMGRAYATEQARSELERNAEITGGRKPAEGERAPVPSLGPTREAAFRARLREATGNPAVDKLTPAELQTIQANGGDEEAVREVLERKERTGSGVEPVGEAMLNQTQTMSVDAGPIVTEMRSLADQAEAGAGRATKGWAGRLERNFEKIIQEQERFSAKLFEDTEGDQIPDSEIRRLRQNGRHLNETTGQYAEIFGPQNNGQREQALRDHSSYYSGVLNRAGGIDNVLGIYFDNPRERELLDLELQAIGGELEREFNTEQNALDREVQREYHEVLKAGHALNLARFNWEKGLVDGIEGGQVVVDPAQINAAQTALDENRSAVYAYADRVNGENWNTTDLAKLYRDDPNFKSMYDNLMSSYNNVYIAMGLMPGPVTTAPVEWGMVSGGIFGGKSVDMPQVPVSPGPMGNTTGGENVDIEALVQQLTEASARIMAGQ